MNHSPRVSIVVPTFREEANIKALVTRIDRALSGKGIAYELIIVDDDSRDGIEDRVTELSGRGLPVRLIIRKKEKGLSSAVITGFREAGGDVLLCMDADLSHPPEKLPELVSAVEQDDCDFVIGSRYIEGASTDERWALHRFIMSKTATLLARPLTTVSDPMSGFFALPRKVFERARDLDPIGFKIALELIVKADCRFTKEIPIHFSDRLAGKSKLGMREQLRYLVHLSRLYRFVLAGRKAPPATSE